MRLLLRAVTMLLDILKRTSVNTLTSFGKTEMR